MAILPAFRHDDALVGRTFPLSPPARPGPVAVVGALILSGTAKR